MNRPPLPAQPTPLRLDVAIAEETLLLTSARDPEGVLTLVARVKRQPRRHAPLAGCGWTDARTGRLWVVPCGGN